MKLALIGYSGCGKSTLAKFLGEKYGIPVLHLDMIHWLPGWEEQEPEKEQAAVKEFMDRTSRWVIDGNYSSLEYERRMEEADRILFLNFNRFTCLFRAVRRFLENRGRTRESMTKGCEEKIDWEFIRWILHDGRTKKQKDRYARIVKKYPEKTIIIKNQRELDAFYVKQFSDMFWEREEKQC